MIFTACPSCNEPQCLSWESGDPIGWFPSRCGSCNVIMWTEATSLGGRTLSHEAFKSEIMQPGDDAYAARAPNHSTLSESK